MNVDNSLTLEFLHDYPEEAARVLEQVSAKHVAALFSALAPQTVAPVMAALIPAKAASCIELIEALPASKLVSKLPVSSAARIFRLLSSSRRNALSALLADKTRRRIHHYLAYSPSSAGVLLDPQIDMLSDSLTVAEAVHRIENADRSVSCEIYIINDAHHLVGTINLGSLMTSSRHARLRDIMDRKTQPVSVHAPLETLLSHPGWTARRRLPMVERDNTLAGALDYGRLQEAIGDTKVVGRRDPLENFLSLASLYWLSVAQLMDSVLGATRLDKGKQP